MAAKDVVQATNWTGRTQSSIAIALIFFIFATGCAYLSLIHLPRAFFISHVGAITLSSMLVALQYYLSPPVLAEVSVRSYLLGHCTGLGIYLASSSRPVWMFGGYLVVLAWFHWSEYFFTAIFCPHSCSKKSFILNHSPAYIIATLVSWLEFVVIYLIWPGFRSYSWISMTGLVICVIGDSLRKLAIATAAESFNHVIEESRRKEHRLITHGIYSFCRHPSYLGWWIYAVGTQILLQNPFCAIAYFFGARHFFADRVQYEEEILVHFFGQAYLNYRQRVPLRLPSIRDPADND